MENKQLDYGNKIWTEVCKSSLVLARVIDFSLKELGKNSLPAKEGQ